MTLSPNQAALLAFIQKHYAETRHAATLADIRAARVPDRHRVTTSAALMRRGLIAVPMVGMAAWLPAEVDAATREAEAERIMSEAYGVPFASY